VSVRRKERGCQGNGRRQPSKGGLIKKFFEIHKERGSKRISRIGPIKGCRGISGEGGLYARAQEKNKSGLSFVGEKAGPKKLCGSDKKKWKKGRKRAGGGE